MEHQNTRVINKNVIAGLLIVGGMIVLVAAVFLAQRLSFGKLTFTIAFSDAKGLEAGDALYMRGVKIGEVRTVTLRPDAVNANVVVDFHDGLPVDSVFFIWTDKLISGRKCIQVKAGNDQEMIQSGSAILGESSYARILYKVGANWLDSL